MCIANGMVRIVRAFILACIVMDVKEKVEHFVKKEEVL